MFSFLAVAWNGSDAAQTTTAWSIAKRLQKTARSWRLAKQLDGLLVYCTDERRGANEAQLLPNGTGVVLGKIFRRNTAEPVSLVDGTSVLRLDANAIVASGGRYLVEECWGRYVAIVVNRQSHSTWVLRDPTGALPCYRIALGELQVIFSDAEDCLAVHSGSYSVDWEFAAAAMCYRRLRSSRTGIREVFELLPGTRVHLRPAREPQEDLIWNPALVAQSRRIEDFNSAVRELRNTTHMCVSAWASCYPTVVHLLSGGLDSSIVLSCLHSAPARPNITCLHHYSSWAPEEDERVYARLAADAAGCELIEHEEPVDAVPLESINNIARSPRPVSYQYQVRHGRFEAQIAKERNATAFFQGAGGDQVFYQGRLPLSVADYFQEHGLRMPLARLALDVSHAHRKSLWWVLGTAIRAQMRSRDHILYAELGAFQSLIRREIIDAVRKCDLVEPWLKAAGDIPRGKLWHILTTSISPPFYDVFGNVECAERIRPLLSQPLIELCLQTPTYVLAAGGVDRAVARSAFAGAVPSKIIHRRSKGGIDAYLEQLLRRNLKFVREFLLDGLLVKERLLDRVRLENALADVGTRRTREAGEILAHHLPLEAWARSWTVPRTRSWPVPQRVEVASG